MIIPPIDPLIVDGGAAGRRTRYACQTTASKVIVRDVVGSGTYLLDSWVRKSEGQSQDDSTGR